MDSTFYFGAFFTEQYFTGFYTYFLLFFTIPIIKIMSQHHEQQQLSRWQRRRRKRRPATKAAEGSGGVTKLLLRVRSSGGIISNVAGPGRRQWRAAGAAKAMRMAAEPAKMTVMLLGRRKWHELHAHLCGDWWMDDVDWWWRSKRWRENEWRFAHLVERRKEHHVLASF